MDLLWQFIKLLEPFSLFITNSVRIHTSSSESHWAKTPDALFLLSTLSPLGTIKEDNNIMMTRPSIT